MQFSINAGIVIQLLSGIISLTMIGYFLIKGKKSALLYSYIWCQCLIFVWSVGQIIEMSFAKRAYIWAAVAFEHMAICFVGAAWLVFSLFYTRSRFGKFRSVLLLIVVPSIIFYSLFLTNEYHHLYYKQFEVGFRTYGIVFWLHVLISYIYVIGGTTIMIRYSVRKPGNARRQSQILILSVMLPLVANIIMIIKIYFNLILIDVGFDITPVSFSLSLLLFALATFRYRFLNIFPIATRKIIDNMRDAVIVVDNYNHVTYYNSAFDDIFHGNIDAGDMERISIIVHKLKERVQWSTKNEEIFEAIAYGSRTFVSREICLHSPSKAYFNVRIQPIHDRRKELIGRIISFNDITEYKNLMLELDEKNHELLAMNEQLKEYADTVEELAIAKERNRFARDVHDSLGHTMTLLISLLEVCRITYKSDADITEEKLEIAVNTAKEGLKELRRSIRGLKPEKLKPGNLVESINQIVVDFRASGVEIDFNSDGVETDVGEECSDTIFRVCQEALTNSVRHGKATNITIMLRFQKENIKLFIIDNGCGCKDINKGFGLSGMEKRVHSIGGSIKYGSDGESGFNIHVEIPLGAER